MAKRIRRVEYDPSWGWIARDKYGVEYIETGFRWSSRSVAQSVVNDDRRMGDRGVERMRADIKARQYASFDAQIAVGG